MPNSTHASRPRAPPRRREQQPAGLRTTSTKEDDGPQTSHHGWHAGGEDTAWRMRLWRRGGGCLAYGHGSYGAA